MANCTYCKHGIEPGTGTNYIKNDGTILTFCSRKCEKNMVALKRNARTRKWTKQYEKGGMK